VIAKIAALIAGCLLLVMPVVAADFGDSLVIVFSGGMRGRADGCGCSSGPQGGLDRRTTILKQHLGAAPYFALDCGGILDLDPDGGLLRSKCTIKGLARENLKAIAVSSRDLFYGTKFLSDVAAETGVELLSLNIVQSLNREATLYRQWLTIPFNNRLIAVTGITSPVQPRSGMESNAWLTLSPDSLGHQLEKERIPAADVTVLLTDLDEASLRRLLGGVSVFDIAITSSPQVYSATPFRVGKCVVLHPENSGRAFDALVVPPAGGSQGIRFISQPIARSTVPDAGTAAWLKECLRSPPIK